MPKLTSPKNHDRPTVHIREFAADPSATSNNGAQINASLAPLAMQELGIGPGTLVRSAPFNAKTKFIQIDGNFPFSWTLDIGTTQHSTSKDLPNVVDDARLMAVAQVHQGQMLSVTTTAQPGDHGFVT